MENKRHNKIVATLWPSISQKWILKQIDKCVDIYRINLSHANLFETRKLIQTIREINSKKVFMLDTKWPEIRTTNKNEIIVNKWDIIKVFSEEKENELSFEYNFFKNIPENVEVSFNDKAVVATILKNNEDFLEIEITQWWKIWYNKTVNFIWYEIELDFLTEKDKEDIKFLVDENIGLIAVSFVKNADDIKRLRNFIKENFDYEAKIIAKIETQSALDNINEIIKASDGIMIARWDLGANIELVELPRLQKKIIKKCNLAWKPVILATQIMSSMVEKPMPTRAEVDEIAFNIENWVDALMLSDETAIGKFPVETLTVLNKVILEYQKDVSNIKFDWEEIKEFTNEEENITDYILYTAKKVASKLWVKFIITPSLSWYTPWKISALKPSIPVIACTDSDQVFKYCNLMFWVSPHKINLSVPYEQLKKMIGEMLQLEFRWKIKWEDKVLIVHSNITPDTPKMINWLEVVKFKDL